MSDEKKKSDRRKQSLYFSEEVLAEISAESKRLERSLSWLLKTAWNLSKDKIKKMPSIDE